MHINDGNVLNLMVILNVSAAHMLEQKKINEKRPK